MTKHSYKPPLKYRLNMLRCKVKAFWRGQADEVRFACNRIIARVTGEDLFWEYEDPWGQMSDCQFKTADAALKHANDKFQEEYDNYEWDGESISGPEDSGEVILIQAFASDSDRVTRRIKATVGVYGDIWFKQEEHGIWNKAYLGLC